MCAARYKDLILESIDQLRKRKARPDLERICHMLERRHGLRNTDVERELDRLVQEEVVIKVDYKGSTSYRNAAKWAKTRSYLTGHVFNSAAVSEALVNAVRKCAADDGVGASLKDVQQYLLSQPAVCKLGRASLETALEREVVAGNLRKLANSGRYVAKPAAAHAKRSAAAHHPHAAPGTGHVTVPQRLAGTKTRGHVAPLKISKMKAIRTLSQAASSKQQVPLVKRGRPASKRKKFKKTHGPDFVEYSDLSCDAYREAEAASEELRCDYCQMTAVTNRRGEAEELLVCKDCNAKAHPSCMDYSPELAARSRMSPWQCIDCKTCALCDDSGDGDSMLFCDSCDKGYHMECHKPKIVEKPTGKWVCSRCVRETRVYPLGTCEPPDSSIDNVVERTNFPKTRPEVDTTGLPTPCDSPAPDEESNRECSSNTRFPTTRFEESAIQNYPHAVPDATSWTIDDVEKFFVYVGFPEQAPSFREQEIDGKSLLLMKRSDVLTGLSIKLGPAVKIYNHVKRLQTGLPDGHLLY